MLQNNSAPVTTIGPSLRRQLTLFIQDKKETIEQIRKEFNPIQYHLIPAHVTLCREDEIEPLELVIRNLRLIKFAKPLIIYFDRVQRFEGGNGVLIPATPNNQAFDELRRKSLRGVNDMPRPHLPHITLMHPRNSTCTDSLFDQISKYHLPTEISFSKISLIEQYNTGVWTIKDEFSFFTESPATHL